MNLKPLTNLLKNRLSLLPARVQPIGLDLGHDGIKMLQLEILNEPGNRPKLSVVAAARQPAPAVEENTGPRSAGADRWVDVVRQMLDSQPFASRHVVASLPREIVQIKNLRLPPMPAAELEAAVRFEGPNLFPTDHADLQLRFLPAGDIRQGNDTRQEVIVLAARTADVDRFLEQLDRAGLVVDALDVELCGAYRAIERFICRREDEQEVQVLVDMGFRRTHVIIGRGREINFFKPVEVGARQLHEAVSRKLGISMDEARALRQRVAEQSTDDDATADQRPHDPVRLAVFDSTRSIVEDLARELAMYLRYHSVTFRGHRPARIRLLGGEAGDPQLCNVLRGVLGLPVEPLRPLAAIDTTRMRPGDKRGTMSEWSLALGLGLRATTERFPPANGRPRTEPAPIEMIATPAVIPAPTEPVLEVAGA